MPAQVAYAGVAVRHDWREGEWQALLPLPLPTPWRTVLLSARGCIPCCATNPLPACRVQVNGKNPATNLLDTAGEALSGPGTPGAA